MTRTRCLRPGMTMLMTIIVMTTLFLCTLIAYAIFVDRDSYIELRNASHAGSLAGVGDLAHDDLLTNDTPTILARLTHARLVAKNVAQSNQAGGNLVTLSPDNPTNDPTGNLVFGRLDKQLGGTFTPLFPLPAATDPFPYDPVLLNAVRIDLYTPARPNIKMRMYAHVDHNIIGYRPTNAVNAKIIPIAILSSSLPAVKSWENALALGTDTNQYVSGTQSFIPGTDNIAEMQIEIGTASVNPAVAEARVLSIGTTTVAELTTQVLAGVTKAQVTPAPYNGEFVLDPGTNTRNVPEFTPAPTLTELDTALAQISNTNPSIPKVFPLYSGIDPMTSEVIVSGYVAARVVNVVVDAGNGRITVTLQPTLLISPNAVTPSTCPAPPPVFRRYVGKLRLAGAVIELP